VLSTARQQLNYASLKAKELKKWITLLEKEASPGLQEFHPRLIHFKTNGFQLTDDQLKKSVGVKDPKNLEQLIASACTATSVDEVLAGVN
jgi:hypothetical protein